ncbi:MAG: hypothetical protein GX442_26645 [Candidatus Riflebacteria bacterium]|nr:hypothetical protein [Candidatus Riflebacteria bacterium]
MSPERHLPTGTTSEVPPGCQEGWREAPALRHAGGPTPTTSEGSPRRHGWRLASPGSPIARRPAARLAALALLIVISASVGCGLRQPQTGSLHGRLLDAAGNVVVYAQVYSLFAEEEKVWSGTDGVFYLSELPAGRNQIVITHASYTREVREFVIPANETVRVEEIRLNQGGAVKFISQVRADTVGSSTAVVTWKTYKPLVCEVEYGPTQSYGQTVGEHDPAEDHALTLTGLTPETLYHFRVRFTDSSSVTWYSYDLSFKTSAGDGPTPPPAVRLAGLPAYGLVDVAWDLSTSTSAVSYQVWRSDNDGPWALMTTDLLDRDTAAWQDQTAVGGHFYRYGVVARNVLGGPSAMTLSPRVFMPGFLTQDLRLTASGSPYILVSDLIVAVGVTLTVEPGVDIRVASVDTFRLGEDPDRVEILVQGRVSMLGTADAPIGFSALDGAASRAHWGGIRIRPGGTGNSELSYVRLFGCSPYAVHVDGVAASLQNLAIRYTQGGVRFDDTRNAPALTACTFDDVASAAISVRGCRRFSIEGCTVTDAGVGVWHEAQEAEERLTMRETHIHAISRGVTGRFSRSVFANCLVTCPDGIGFDYLAADGAENDLDHCTVVADIGIRIASGTPRVKNNLVVNLDGDGTYGIQVTGPAGPIFSYNNLSGFATAYQGCSGGAGAASFAPDFVGGNPYDYHLQPASALRLADQYGLEIGRYGKSYL